MKFISKINSIFTNEFLDEMFDLYKQHKFYITDNEGKQIRIDDVRHIKSLKFRELLSNYFAEKNIPFAFLGDGTNRMSFLVDGYVFKLALDDQGYIDNLTEFKMSKEAQPYVTKTYETNGLFCVAEYVTLISYDEFVKQKSRILEILDILSTEYLLGDMGWTKKNYCNWGYRKNSKDLVILDYGHMIKIDSNKLICHECGGFLSYNSTYTEIQCLSCGKKLDFMAMKSKISKKEEITMIDDYLNKSVSTDESEVEVENTEVERVHVVEQESEEIVSNRFVGFQTEQRKRFSDMMEDDEVVDEEDTDNYDYNYALSLLNKKQQPVKVKREVEVPSQLMKVQDLKLRRLLTMEKEDAEYLLMQELATGQVNMTDYNYYMSKVSEYEGMEFDENVEEVEELSTIGEVLQSKGIDVEEEQEVVQKEDEEDYYTNMMNQLNKTNVQQVEDEVEEETGMDNETIDKMNQMMHKLLYAEDDGDLYPEDFIANNLSNLGFDEEDSEEDEQEFDRVLENIKRGNNVDLDELEDMIDDEDEEEAVVTQPELQVIDPVNDVEEEPEVKEEPTVEEEVVEDIVLDEKFEVTQEVVEPEPQPEPEPEKFVFKIQRNNQSTQMSINNEEKFTTKQNNKNNVGLVVNDVDDEPQFDNAEDLASALLRYNAKNNEDQ